MQCGHYWALRKNTHRNRSTCTSLIIRTRTTTPTRRTRRQCLVHASVSNTTYPGWRRVAVFLQPLRRLSGCWKRLWHPRNLSRLWIRRRIASRVALFACRDEQLCEYLSRRGGRRRRRRRTNRTRRGLLLCHLHQTINYELFYCKLV